MSRFAVTVTDRHAAPAEPRRAQKCKCKCPGPVSFEVSVADRDLGPAQSRGAQKCKCSCAPSLQPGTEMLAKSGSLQLSPLGD